MSTYCIMTKEGFEDLLLELQQSGKTQKEFLANKGIGYSTFSYWKHKFQSDAKDTGLAPISIKKHSASGVLFTEVVPVGATLLFPNGLRAHFGSGTEEMLMELLNRSLSAHVLP